jgi:DNA-binding GntR family transcriptional regulator
MDIDSSSKVDVAYAKLKELVTHYDLVAERNMRILPGQHLNIDELSDRVRASATPVRQALERLHGAGLIDCIPKRGFFAKVPDATELQELYEFAELVLDRSILAARDSSAVDSLQPDLGATAPASAHSVESLQRNAAVIEDVLERIARLSRNEQMLRMIRNFHDRSHYVRCLSLACSPDPSLNREEIVGLVDLIRAGQIGPARATLRGRMALVVSGLPEVIRRARSRWAEPSTIDANDMLRLQPIATSDPKAAVAITGKTNVTRL